MKKKLLAISYFYLSFSYFFFFCFKVHFQGILYSQPSSTPDFYGLKGQKKYVYVYRNRVYLIFHDTNNPIIMTRLLFSILTRYYSFSSSSSSPP